MSGERHNPTTEPGGKCQAASGAGKLRSVPRVPDIPRRPGGRRASAECSVSLVTGLLDTVGYLLAQRRPFQQGVECWTESLAPIGQPVFDLGRHLMVDDSPHHAVVFHLAKLLDQHLLGNCGNGPLQLRESQDVPAEQMEEDQELPPALEDLERLLHVPRGGDGRILPHLTSL